MARAHVIGAGLAGLAAAVELAKAGVPVTLYEQAVRAGGRCRSFHDAALDCTIDNGNHLLLSGNTSALAYLDAIGARDRLTGPAAAEIAFCDLATGERWSVRPNRGRIPWWIAAPRRRVPGTRLREYLSALRLLGAAPQATVREAFGTWGPLGRRLWEPLVVAALNAPPERAAAVLLKPVLLETFGRGADACRPLIAREGLSDTFIDPAVAWLEAHGARLRLGSRVSRLHRADDRIVGFAIGVEDTAVGPEEAVVLAVPPAGAVQLVPGLVAPGEASPIVNLHFRIEGGPLPLMAEPLLGLVGGLAQWLFVRGEIASVTISAADAIVDEPAETLAWKVWAEVAQALGRPGAAMPRVRVIKERRATFLQTPAEAAKRPPTGTEFRNLFLAGDWTDTGLPATIEGAVRSGVTAAQAAIAWQAIENEAPPRRGL